jgi:hypothetical protein
MIGSHADAARALIAYDTGDNEFLLSDEGTTRAVYLINGVIYKVNRVENGIWDINEMEWTRYLNMNDLPRGVFLPEMFLYRVGEVNVMASEFIDGIPIGECMSCDMGDPCEDPEFCMDPILIEELHHNFGWSDSAWGNAVECDGVIYLIDVAC